MKKFYITFILALPLFLFSQGENDNWYFGAFAGVNFSGSTPTVLYDSQAVTNLASASVSDSSGKLLFYTNGLEVFNREHQLMPNGSGLTQETHFQISIVKHPTNPNLYYIISGGVFLSGTNKVRYTVVDMSQGSLGSNGLPLGDVLANSTGLPMLDQFGNDFTTAKGVTVVPHANNSAYWVLIQDGTNLYSYLLDSNGLANTPVVTDLGAPSSFSHYAYIKASEKLSSCSNFSNYISITTQDVSNNYNEGRVYSFDNNTGHFTNDYYLVIANLGPIYTEFNKNSSILYVAALDFVKNDAPIYAIDLVNSTNTNLVYNNVTQSQIPNNYFEGMQRNTKGDIYVKFGYNDYISKIINPDVFGGSSLDWANLYLLPGLARSFPQLVPSLKENEGGGNCVSNITLQTPEINFIYTYQAGNTIITKDNYIIDKGRDITMKAGNYVNLLPGTDIKPGSKYLATIASCEIPCNPEALGKKNVDKNNMFLDLRKKESKTNMMTNNIIDIYPNPVSDLLNIKSNVKIEKVEIFDISGKKINIVLNSNKIDVKSIPSGSYIVIIETKEGKTTKKFIKK
ncbi:T9SS type A sorting domain-containing protein [Chryseobacterium sp. G0201]|uniref:T9SS type A sorting domain-containing protein n=1 Tax=Chryseobacterium sp. G0201 TaxID=2487065 RepID=UPI000F509907|nr:T9SS type A sorting domain-containing protein [Chryseobacterium sp. G0201]AZA53716.1 T9SS C-terminal target domain-containing protein [Chryseobacterium sp. G0201]